MVGTTHLLTPGCLNNYGGLPRNLIVVQHCYLHLFHSISIPQHKMSSRRESDFARLEQQLQEAREHAEHERQRADEEQQNQLGQEKKTRSTTFEEYISNCHKFLLTPLHIQTDKNLSTQGSITNLENKSCPTLLNPWTDFPIQQQRLFKKVYEHIP